MDLLSQERVGWGQEVGFQQAPRRILMPMKGEELLPVIDRDLIPDLPHPRPPPGCSVTCPPGLQPTQIRGQAGSLSPLISCVLYFHFSFFF